MKQTRLFFFAAALMVAACTEIVPVISVDPCVTTFEASVDNTPDFKAALGINGESQPQTFWEDGDEITVYSTGDGPGTVESAGYKFSTSLLANATTATFTYAGEVPAGNYMAIYPAASANRNVNYDAYRMAAVDVPRTQTLVAGSFDRSAAVAVAYAPEGSGALNFKNLVALVKFQVADDDVVDGRIVVDDADAIAGRFRADFDTESANHSLATYSGATTYSYVSFSLGGSTLSTGTDYYVAVRPADLTSGFKIYLNGCLVKSYTAVQVASFARSKIYNAGTLSKPATPASKLLHFDFSGAALPGWPTADKWDTKAGNLACTYPLYGTNYSFICADVSEALNARVAWDASKGGVVLFNSYRYLGLPAISGYKLVKVTGSLCLGDKSTRKAGITASVAATTSDPYDYVSGGSQIGWTKSGAVYSYSLTGTAANTVYYLTCTSVSIGTSYLDLVYERVL